MYHSRSFKSSQKQRSKRDVVILQMLSDSVHLQLLPNAMPLLYSLLKKLPPLYLDTEGVM
jgi:hypothetical protein